MKKAFLIASSEFDDDSGIEPLRFPLNDVAAMERVLTSDNFGFAVTKAENEQCQALREQLDAWMSEAEFSDLLLLYFSGHGKLNTAGELFLTCRNTKDRLLPSTGLKWSHVREMMNDRSTDRVGIILDCCYAGKATIGDRGTIEEQVRANAAEGRGIILLGASGATQTAEEREADGHGRFTKQIIEGLTSGDADVNDDGHISFRDLAEYVKREFKKQNVRQNPIEQSILKSGDLVLGTSYKKTLLSDLQLVRTRFLSDRDYFSRATFRRIEDYIDQVSEMVPASDPRGDIKFRALVDYAGGKKSLENLIDAFREPIVVPRSPAATSSQSSLRHSADPQTLSLSTKELRRPAQNNEQRQEPIPKAAPKSDTYNPVARTSQIDENRYKDGAPVQKKEQAKSVDTFFVKLTGGLFAVCFMLFTAAVGAGDQPFQYWTFSIGVVFLMLLLVALTVRWARSTGGEVSR